MSTIRVVAKGINNELENKLNIKDVSPEANHRTRKATEIALPLLIAQSKHQPGKNQDGGVADDMLCGDMTKSAILAKFWDGIIKIPSIYVLKALTFENADIHFGMFKQIATTLFARNNITLYRPVYIEDLKEKCYITKEPIVGGTNLEDNIIKMIDHFRYKKGANYSNSDLTNAVLCNKNTIKFFNDIRKDFANQLAKKKGDLGLIEVTKNIGQPSYTIWGDLGRGLTIALNDIWAYKVWVTDYQLEKNGTYRGNMKIAIYDHFGLDVNDVRLTKFAHHTEGFYHWFALQHWEGFKKKYKPFVTVIETDLLFKGKI